MIDTIYINELKPGNLAVDDGYNSKFRLLLSSPSWNMYKACCRVFFILAAASPRIEFERGALLKLDLIFSKM
jgi:hypothetical protein